MGTINNDVGPSDAADARDASAAPQEPNATTSTGGTIVIVGIIVGLLLIIAVAVDVSCYFINKTGQTFID